MILSWRANPPSAFCNPQRIRSVSLLALVVSALCVFGCAQNAPQRQYYILEAQRPGGSLTAPEPADTAAPPTALPQSGHPAEGASGPGGGILEVRRFRVDVAFGGRQLVYRVGEFRYESDYYHQFLVPPGTMIAEKTRDWLAASGLFEQVVALGSAAPATYTLTGNVIALYGDFANPAAPAAVLEIHFSLSGGPEGKEAPFFAQTYRAISPLASKTADAVVAALDQNLVEILTRLEEDLRAKIQNQASDIKAGGVAARP